MSWLSCEFVENCKVNISWLPKVQTKCKQNVLQRTGVSLLRSNQIYRCSYFYVASPVASCLQLFLYLFDIWRFFIWWLIFSMQVTGWIWRWFDILLGVWFEIYLYTGLSQCMNCHHSCSFNFVTFCHCLFYAALFV